MSKAILALSPQNQIATAVRHCLRGFTVTVAKDITDLKSLVTADDFDLIVVDCSTISSLAKSRDPTTMSLAMRRLTAGLDIDLAVIDEPPMAEARLLTGCLVVNFRQFSQIFTKPVLVTACKTAGILAPVIDPLRGLFTVETYDDLNQAIARRNNHPHPTLIMVDFNIIFSKNGNHSTQTSAAYAVRQLRYGNNSSVLGRPTDEIPVIGLIMHAAFADNMVKVQCNNAMTTECLRDLLSKGGDLGSLILQIKTMKISQAELT